MKIVTGIINFFIGNRKKKEDKKILQFPKQGVVYIPHNNLICGIIDLEKFKEKEKE